MQIDRAGLPIYDNLSTNISQFGADGELGRWEYQIGLTELPGFDFIAGIDLENEVNGADERDNTGVYTPSVSGAAGSGLSPRMTTLYTEEE